MLAIHHMYKTLAKASHSLYGTHLEYTYVLTATQHQPLV